MVCIDVRNERCSKALLHVKSELKKIKPSEVLEVLADPYTKKEIVEIFSKRGHKVISVQEEVEYFRITLKKSEKAPPPES
ncbi:MAG: sulfurtransferase TusA family protein [Candidatus Bathyarchaeia archaeon]